MKKNPNLTLEQENILFNEATEPPGSSELNNEKREGPLFFRCLIHLIQEVQLLH